MPGVSGPTAKYLLFSVDTEPDDEHWEGLGEGPWSRENLRGLPELQRRLGVLGVRATYLITHSVAAMGRLEDILAPSLAADACEIGTHFHPGDTPPFPRIAPEPGNGAVGKAAGKDRDNILRVPTDLLEAKFENLHALIVSRFGKPASHRSGAWALDSRVIRLLVKHGYKVDSSVTPGVSWKRNARPSYLGAPMHAYTLGDGDPCIAGDTGILEVPVSIWSPRRWDGTLAGRLIGDMLTMPLAARGGMGTRIVRALRPEPPQWLRPAFMEVPEMERSLQCLESEGADYLHVMCHSNELWPGTSPYFGNRQEPDRFYARLDGIFRIALSRGYRPVTLAQYAEAFHASAGRAPAAPTA
jgi:hypothetical protein